MYKVTLVVLCIALASANLNRGDWNRLFPTGSSPAPVAYNAGVAFGDFIYTFGGYLESQTPSVDNVWYNRVHRYDTIDNHWVQLHPLGTQPGARGYHFWFQRGVEMVIGFGGTFSSTFTIESIYNDLWGYNILTNTWRLINAGTGPGPLLGPAAVYNPITDKISFFGGITQFFAPQSATWEYSFATNTWTMITTAVAPSARYDMLNVRDPLGGKMIIYGGETLNEFFQFVIPADVMWSFDFGTKSWTQINPRPAMPPRNNGNGAIFHHQSMLLTGGDIGGGVACGAVEFAQNIVNETWSFNAITNGFTQLCPAHSIVGLKRATSVLVDDNFFVFGGWSFDNANCTGPIFNNNVWAMPLTFFPPGGPAC